MNLERATMLLAQAREQAERLRGWWLEAEANKPPKQVWVLSCRVGGYTWDVEGVFSDPAKALAHVDYYHGLPANLESWSWYRRDLSVHRTIGDYEYKIENMDVWS